MVDVMDTKSILYAVGEHNGAFCNILIHFFSTQNVALILQVKLCFSFQERILGVVEAG